MVLSLLLIPLILLPAALILRSDRVRSWLLPLAGTFHLGLLLTLWLGGSEVSGYWFALDPLGLLILLTISTLYCAAAFYAVGYLHYRRDRGNRVMVPCLLFLLAAVTAAACARHLGLLWVTAETTTLAIAPLIYYNRNALSIEATWKYLLICSVGIALAMLGLLFVAYSALHGGQPVSLHLNDLFAAGPALSRPWLHAGFVLMLVGFGVKLGLAPLHSWKPDAYGEAPGLVGALLAGGLTSISFLAILRGVQLLAANGELQLARISLIGLGLISVVTGAIFMVRQSDVKRLLAYSSVEHMGLLVIGIGAGGTALVGALLHLLFNALTKGVLFLTIGNIHRAFASKRLEEIRGALSRLPLSAGLFLAGFLAATGSPPFAPFVSLFTLIRGLLDSDPLIAAVVLIALSISFIGMAWTILALLHDEPPASAEATDFRDSWQTVGPPLVLLLLVVILGLTLPEPLRQLIDAAARLLEVPT